MNADRVFSRLRDPRLAPGGAAAEEQVGFLPVEIIDADVEPGGEPEADAPGLGPGPAGRIELEIVGAHRPQIVGPHDPEAPARLIRGLSGP